LLTISSGLVHHGGEGKGSRAVHITASRKQRKRTHRRRPRQDIATKDMSLVTYFYLNCTSYL
jgi:hypothetical protein